MDRHVCLPVVMSSAHRALTSPLPLFFSLPLLLQAFQGNKVEGGAQNTITPIDSRFGISVPANCVANGIPEIPVIGAEGMCSDTEAQPFFIFDFSVPASTQNCKLFPSPSLFPPPSPAFLPP